MANETAWKNLQDLQANRQPTPPVGEPIVWFQGADRKHPVAARCNGIEGPGRIKITILPWMGVAPMHRSACYHIDHPMHQKPNETTKNNGAWDYVRGRIPKDDYTVHDEEYAKREKALIEAEDQAQKDAELFARKRAEKEAEAPKKSKILESPVPV